jgi:ABC-type glutathione transport system ATPase component
MPEEAKVIDLARQSVQSTLGAVFSGKDIDAGAQSTARTVQSIGQTTAIVIQDAADMLRNVNTIETTTIGAATAKWIATRDPVYREIIENALKVMQEAAALYLTIGTNAHEVLTKFKTAD